MLRSLTSLFALAALPALAEPPKIVTDIAPLHSLVAQVMEGVGAPVLLADGGQDPHAVALKPSQVRAVQNADAVYWMGEQMAPWLADVLESTEQDAAFVTLDMPGVTLQEFDTRAKIGEEANEDEHGHDEHHHDQSGVDPHAWLSVDNAKAWVNEIARDLAARDPENAATYAANAEKTLAGLAALDADIKARLAPHQGAEIITFHAAYGYFASAYGIDVLGSLRPGDATAPSAAMVAALKEAVDEHDVACAFGEPGHDPDALDAVASDAGLRIDTLDPSGRTFEPGAALYSALLTNMAEAIAACLEAS